MKNCTRCNATLDDGAMFCTSCGLKFNAAPAPEQPVQNTYAQPNQAAYQAPAVGNVYDHTAEFSAQEVSDNKLYAMLIYLTSILGIIVALIAQTNKKSAYLDFHIKQNIKVIIIQMFISLAMGVLAVTFVAPILGAIALGITVVVQFIGFFKTAGNKSVELPIIRNFGFLK